MITRVGALALTALVVAASACSDSAPRKATVSPAATEAGVASPRAPAAAPSPPPATATPSSAPTPVAATDLTFAGAMTGQVLSATSAGLCGLAPAGLAAELHFTLSNQPVVLSIAVLDYHGPGQYGIPPERVFVRTGSAPGGQFLPATKGSLTVDGGARSGRIDATLGDGSTRVSGTWICT